MDIESGFEIRVMYRTFALLMSQFVFHSSVAEVGIHDGAQINAINPGCVRPDRPRSLWASQAVQHPGNAEAATEKTVRKANGVRLDESEDVANLEAGILSPQVRLLQGILTDFDGGETKTV